ncbi:type II toxin-antitoxin system RelE/ParE family toxin [Aquimarina sp. I32.4]|uniref:type II toxin-antitoxin system RelE/ParE family toxin n=1 Tax=Aquimarina sp. I32.4 TaxID=2053903 RepID=UPI000CDEBA95|nr:type II toxin-antitoxin system RelE/ParE family toxin [Aquimarina sp. I32.4]
MGYQIQVSKEAEKDLAIAKCHYKASGLEREFTEDFSIQIKYLKANPYLFQVNYKRVRKIHFETYKYSIHYVIDNNIVYVLRILSHSQEYDNT